MKKAAFIYAFAAFIAFSCTETKFFPKDPTPSPAPTVSPSPSATPVPSATPAPTETPFVPKPSPTPATSAPSAATVKANIQAIAEYSTCSKVNWKDRGTAPMSYYKGMALSYARTLCHPERAEVKLLEDPFGSTVTDALPHYGDLLPKKSKTHNVYLILMGLGLQESSGKYCCGRDMSADFDSADSAEAGTFQSSYGAKRVSPVLEELFQTYKRGERKCYLEYYSPGVSCGSANAKNWGSGAGFEWQKLIKECPAFGTEWAAILVRKTGGEKGEFGPLRKKAAQIKPECDAMLDRVEAYVKLDGVCSTL